MLNWILRTIITSLFFPVHPVWPSALVVYLIFIPYIFCVYMVLIGLGCPPKSVIVIKLSTSSCTNRWITGAVSSALAMSTPARTCSLM